MLLILGAPGAHTIAGSSPWIVAGLALRAWSFAYLGGQGRTRDPSAPSGRVVSGPYARIEHPVYVANLLVATGLTVAIAPPGTVAAIALGGVGGLYAVLAARESDQVRGLDPDRRPRRTLRQVARSERSTWVTVAGLWTLAALL